MKNIFQVVLLILVVVLAWMVWDSPNQKIRFDKEKETRDKAIIQNLIDIRTAQEAYKDKYGDYTASFDTLIDFIKNDSTPMVFKQGFLTDSMIEAGITEKKGIELGILVRDTSYAPVFTELYKDRKGFSADSLCYVPYKDTMQFEMEKGVFVTTTNVNIKVFEARTPYKSYLGDMDKQEVDNLIAYALKYDKYPGLKVGSVEEANNNAGNWE